MRLEPDRSWPESQADPQTLRADGKKRQSAVQPCWPWASPSPVIFGLGTLGCLIGLGIISPTGTGDVVVSTAEDGGILMTGTGYVMNTAYSVLGIVGGVLGLAGGLWLDDGLPVPPG